MDTSFLSRLGDQQLFLRISANARHCREGEVTLLYDLAEVDRRRLYLQHGATSLFDFCTRRLHLSESSAYKRMTVARALGHFAQLAEALRSGRLHLAGAVVLVPVLDKMNVDRWLAAAAFKSRREIEALVAAERACQGEVAAPKAASLKAMPVIAGGPSHLDTKLGTQEQTSGFFDNSRRSSNIIPRDAGQGVAVRAASQSAAETPRAAAPKTGAAPNSAPAPEPAPKTAAAAAAVEAETPVSDQVQAAPQGAAHHGNPSSPPEASHRAPPCRSVYSRLAVSLDLASCAALQEVRALLAHQVPNGDLNVIIGLVLQRMARTLKEQKFGLKKAKPQREAKPADKAQAKPSVKKTAEISLTPPLRSLPAENTELDEDAPGSLRPAFTEQEIKYKKGLCSSPKTPSIPARSIPRPMRREVFLRDAGKCTYLLSNGQRCETTRQLEYHHIAPFAKCGSHAVDNITLHCRAHNALAAEEDFGPGLMRRYCGGKDRHGKISVRYPAAVRMVGGPPASQSARCVAGS